ncbi:hypothetical protein MAN_07924, partial [Metarhizium hybridum]
MDPGGHRDSPPNPPPNPPQGHYRDLIQPLSRPRYEETVADRDEQLRREPRAYSFQGSNLADDGRDMDEGSDYTRGSSQTASQPHQIFNNCHVYIGSNQYAKGCGRNSSRQTGSQPPRVWENRNPNIGPGEDPYSASRSWRTLDDGRSPVNQNMYIPPYRPGESWLDGPGDLSPARRGVTREQPFEDTGRTCCNHHCCCCCCCCHGFTLVRKNHSAKIRRFRGFICS